MLDFNAPDTGVGRGGAGVGGWVAASLSSSPPDRSNALLENHYLELKAGTRHPTDSPELAPGEGGSSSLLPQRASGV